MAEIVIDLDNSKDAIALEAKNIIHQNEFIGVNSLIRKKIDEIKEEKVVKNRENHDTITILGTRGSGKTTFLKTIREYYEKSEEIKVIDIIDPTLIEEKGHIFLTFISIIKKIVDTKIRTENYPEDKERDWDKAVNNLAYGLPSMDGVGAGLAEVNWQDPEYIMAKGLLGVNAAFNLADTFHLFIVKALDILDRKAFLVAFDDIDVDFRKGWPVLEMIRKYFTTNRVITLLSGDLRLYSLAIRKQKWKNFGRALLINEGQLQKKDNYYNDLVTEMEGQYMLKVLKPERRFHLTSLLQKINLNNTEYDDFSYLISSEKLEDSISIVNCYKNLLSKFGISNNYQAEASLSFLLGLPIRTQIQILAEYYEHRENLKNLNVFDPFLADLIEKEIDTNVLESSSKLVNVAILKLLLKEKELADIYQLQPTTSDVSLNASLFALSLYSSLSISQNRYLIFDYFIKIGYVRNLLNELPYQESGNEKGLSSIPSIENFCKHSGLYQDKVLRDIVGNMNAYISGNITGLDSKLGLITLPGLGYSSKKSNKEIAGRIDKVFFNKAVSKEMEVLGLIPLSISASARVNQSVPTYSIYTLLASIGELIRKQDVEDLNKGLIELSQIRTYLIPEFKKGVNEGSEIGELDIKEVEKNDNSIDNLIKEIKTWISQFPSDKGISPHLLGKISTRFFFALNSIENAEKAENLGIMMHNRIIAFMNATLLEDARENVSYFNEFNNNNTNLVDNIFIQNLKAAISSNYKGNLYLSKWLVSCPLLLCYLNRSSQLTDLIERFTDATISAFSKQNSLYKLLLQVEVNDSKKAKHKTVEGVSLNYPEVARILIKNKVPFSLFKHDIPPNEIQLINVKAKEYISRLLNETWKSDKLRRFRYSLYENNISW